MFEVCKCGRKRVGLEGLEVCVIGEVWVVLLEGSLVYKIVFIFYTNGKFRGF